MGEKDSLNTIETVQLCQDKSPSCVTQNSFNEVQKVSYKIGGKYCIARWCNNSRRTNPNVTLFRLPVKDKDRSCQWLKNSSREDLIGKNVKYLHALRLCDKHFTADMFMNVTRKRLNCRAIPTLFPKPVIVQHLDEKRLKGHLDQDNTNGLQQTSKQPRPILPKTSCLSRSTAEMKSTKSKQTNFKTSPHYLNLHSHLHMESSVSESVKHTSKDLSNVFSVSAMSSKQTEIDTESLFCQSVDKDHAFSETESMCNDHSFQKWDDTIYPCPSCGEMFLVRSNLVRHQTTFHSERSVHCDMCGMLVMSKSEFLEHICAKHPS